MRYKFYREHKYVSAALNKLERLIAKTDFRSYQETSSVKTEWQEVSHMLHEHAKYEEERLHPLLEKKGSKAHLHAHEDHESFDDTFRLIDDLLEAINNESSPEKKVEKGYQLYLTYRKFVGENLLHLHEEETSILPELQKHYTDSELRMVEEPTYKAMTPNQLTSMLNGLFPHMNASDKEAFLDDIQRAAPGKFEKLTSFL
ncbi:MAG: hemerythrin domain-containing protein [Candidatus Algichlamydia australiensis]|nr:hemerythrin domain-containing protein [Chlamydiales bacterium]